MPTAIPTQRSSVFPQHRFLAAFLAALAVAAHAHAQSASDCASLMKFGVYDKYRTFSSESHFRQVQEFFKSNQFSTTADAESKAGELGLDIADILGLKLNGKAATSQFSQWQQELLKATYTTVLNAGLKSTSVDRISNALTDLVGKCLLQKGVHVYIIPSADNQTFSVTVDFVPTASAHPSTSGTIQISPASVAASCTPPDKLNSTQEIGPQGVSVSCRRLPSETVTVIVNTQDGAPTIHYEAYVVPKPQISFKANDNVVDSGGTTRLVWEVRFASRVTLEGFGQVPDNGFKEVTPTKTAEYVLSVVSLDGQEMKAFATVAVRPPPPVLSGAKVEFYTTDDDKDDDTHVTVSIMCGGSTVANVGGTWGHFDDNSASGWKGFAIVAHPKKTEVLGACIARLVEAPNGHDEWHFNWALELTFSDGSVTRYDWGGGNVDYDRTTITVGL